MHSEGNPAVVERRETSPPTSSNGTSYALLCQEYKLSELCGGRIKHRE